MNGAVHTLEIVRPALPAVDRREALRYAGCPDTAHADVNVLLDECAAELVPHVHAIAVYRRLPVAREGEILRIGLIETTSEKLKKNLAGCDSAVVFAATAGMDTDRLIRKYTRVQPSKALMLQALGAERVEALCDALEAELAPALKDEGLARRPRFSPGYGDFPLTHQRDIFKMLNCEKTIGVTLNESLLMSPSKSVTAVIGLYPGEDSCGPASPHRCWECGKADCAYRM